jgi:hypothetical protein
MFHSGTALGVRRKISKQLHTAFAVMPSGKLKTAREILRNLIVSASLKLSAKIAVRLGGGCGVPSVNSHLFLFG